MKQHKTPHNLNLSSSNLHQSLVTYIHTPIYINPWLPYLVGVWVHMLAYILARCNCIATVTAPRKSPPKPSQLSASES